MEVKKLSEKNMYKLLSQLLDAKEKRELILLFFIILSMAFVETLGVASIMPFMALLSNPDLASQNIWYSELYVYFKFTSVSSFQFFLGVIVLLIIVITNIFAAYTTWRINKFTAKGNHRFAFRMLENYLCRPYQFFLDRNTAELGKNILTETLMLTEGVILPLLQLVAKLLTVCLILVLLLWANPMLVLVMGGLSGIGYSIIYIYSQSKLGSYGKEKLELNSARYKMAGEALEGIKDIRILGKESFFLDRFSTATKKFSEINATYQLIKALPRHLLEVLAFGGIMIITLYLLSAENDTSKIIPVLSLYALAGYRLMPASQQIYLSLATIKYNRAAADLICCELEEKNYKANIFSDVSNACPVFNRTISLKNVWFGYDGENPLFKNINLTIEKNNFIAFVGETGSGKSTLVDILMALHEPQQGSLSVDDGIINLSNAFLWRKKTGYVPQQIYLLDDTIASNIALGHNSSSIDFEQLELVARTANIHDFITKELSESYQTIVGERGVRLSGGQRQRIGIARALYHNPEVIIFDEATSALDGITESAVMEAITKLGGNKTMIIIAHRLTTVEKCDKIYVIDKGEVVDQGNYEELLKRNINFSSMLDPNKNK
jgi:ATP-binding cassette, subfamily B, bacterial PglK